MDENGLDLIFSGLKEIKPVGKVWGKFSLKINGEKIVFKPYENKKDFFYFDFSQTILAIKYCLKMLQQNESFECPIVVDFSGDEDSHSIRIKIKQLNSNVRVELVEIFEGMSFHLYGPVVLPKPEFSKKLKSFLNELRLALKGKIFFKK